MNFRRRIARPVAFLSEIPVILMAMTTRDPIVCECGYMGFLKCKESEQPDGKLWESYSLEGFKGSSIWLGRCFRIARLHTVTLHQRVG